MKRIATKAGLWTLALLILLYAGDYLVLRYQKARGRAFGSVTIYRYYAIEKKANRVEYDAAGTENQTCVHTLFPQVGYIPCWYAERHTEKKIEI
jgi:hypothetical protein